MPLWLIAPILVLAVLALAALAFGLYGSLYLTRPLRYAHRVTPAEMGLPGEAVTFPSRDGLPLAGWLIPAENAKGTIVFGHGYGGGLDEHDFQHAAVLHRHGYRLLLFDFRGQGASGGHYRSMGAREQDDMLGAIAFLQSSGLSDRLGAFGVSMGAVVAYIVAAQRPEVRAVVGDSAFASWQGIIRHGLIAERGAPPFLATILAWLVTRLTALRLGFRAAQVDPVRFIGRISPRPVLIIHGAEDRQVPAEDARQLYAAAAEPKELWIVPGAGHTGSLAQAPEEYVRRVVAFFNRWLVSEEGNQEIGKSVNQASL